MCVFVYKFISLIIKKAMALKDHITDSAKLSEEEIEAIIADYIKYDPANKKVVFLPKTHGLSVEKKILLHLVSLRGWRFIVKENPPATDASPREIENTTSIRGGTLRPMLRALVQSKMIDSRKGRYEIPAHNFGRVRDTMAGKGTTVTSRPSSQEYVGKKKSSNKQDNHKKTSHNKPSLAETFEKLIKSNWFKGGKTLTQLKEKLEEMAVIVPTSHLPAHLLKACRGENPSLLRNKEIIEGKKLWVYSQNI
jgi:hypothetical protein